MRTIYREKKYVCGEYLEVAIYPVYRKAGTRAKRAKPTRQAQAALNRRNSINHLIRLIHTNFGAGDLSLTLSYREEELPGDEGDAARQLTNFLRRVKRLRTKRGLPPLRYIAVTERSARGRFHHHLILSGGIARDELEELWGLGYANTRRLQWDERGLVGLGQYIMKEPIGGKRYSYSKNLVKPQPRTRDGRLSRRKVETLAREETALHVFDALYPGWRTVEVEPFYNAVNGGVYLSVRCYRERTCKERGRSW